jgi:NAD(P)H-flavin reductase
MSMLSYALETLKTTRTLVLYQGFRYEKDIFAHEFFTSLATKYPNFSYKLTLSKAGDDWMGLRGRITEYYLADLKDADKDVCAYICGSKNVIADVQTKLNQIGIPAGQIYFEQFY